MMRSTLIRAGALAAFFAAIAAGAAVLGKARYDDEEHP